jgi:flagellar biosynthesis/type III secretory pathway ATPase
MAPHPKHYQHVLNKRTTIAKTSVVKLDATPMGTQTRRQVTRAVLAHVRPTCDVTTKNQLIDLVSASGAGRGTLINDFVREYSGTS